MILLVSSCGLTANSREHAVGLAMFLKYRGRICQVLRRRWMATPDALKKKVGLRGGS